jgi:hypothetical protein
MLNDRRFLIYKVLEIKGLGSPTRSTPLRLLNLMIEMLSNFLIKELISISVVFTSSKMSSFNLSYENCKCFSFNI